MRYMKKLSTPLLVAATISLLASLVTTAQESWQPRAVPSFMKLDKSKYREVWLSDGEVSKQLPAIAQGSLKPQGILAWQTILSDGFENGFPSTTWKILYGGPEAYWDDVTYKARTGNRSVWCAKGGSQGVDPASGNYPDNMNAWMKYGPFSLANAADAYVRSDHWTITENDSDRLICYVSIDEDWYYGTALSGDWTNEQGNINGWMHYDFDLKEDLMVKKC